MFKYNKIVWILFTVQILLLGCREPEPQYLNIAWKKTYTGNQGAKCGDALPADGGGYFVVGTTNIQYTPEKRGDVYLMRIDGYGEILWEKTFGGEPFEAGQKMIQTMDESLVIVGEIESEESESIDAYLIKVDQDGNIIWSRTFGGPQDERIRALQETVDGGYILIGNKVNPNDPIADPGRAGYGGYEARSNICLIKTDNEGNELWSRSYDSKQNVVASSGLQTSDGGYLILATIIGFPDFDNDVFLFKVNGSGSQAWSRTWKQGRSSGYDLVQCSDGNYLVTGPYMAPAITSSSKIDFLFIKFDKEGNEIWVSIFGDPRQGDKGSVLTKTADGCYAAAGERTPDWYTRDADISLVKINENGQPLWRQYWPATHTMYSTLFQHRDGGYFIAGTTNVNGRSCIILLKTEPEGQPIVLK